MPNFGPDISKFKMVIYLTSNDKKTFYSLTNEENKGNERALNGMVSRLLFRKYRGKYQTALIYAKVNGQWTSEAIQKWVYGTKEY